MPHGPRAVLVGRFPMARRARLMLLAGRKPSPSYGSVRVDVPVLESPARRRLARLIGPAKWHRSGGASARRRFERIRVGSTNTRENDRRRYHVVGHGILEEHGVGRWEDSGTISRIDPEDRRGSGQGALGDGQPRGRRDVRLHAPAGARTAKRRLSVSSTLSRPECCPTDRDRSPLCGSGRAD